MEDRETRILEAALKVLLQYGVAKTTMADIATEAEVSRQTLYNLYDGKDDVLRAVVGSWGKQTLLGLETAWAKNADLSLKLDSFFEHVPLAWWDMIQSSPQAADVIEGTSKVARAELERTSASFVEAMAAMLSEHVDRTVVDCDTLADFIYSAATNSKYSAPNRTTLQTRLQMLKECVLAKTRLSAA